MEKKIVITLGEIDKIIGSKTYGSCPVKLEHTPGMSNSEILHTIIGVLQGKQNELINENINLQNAILNATKLKAI